MATATDPVHHLDPSAPFKYGTSWDWRKGCRGEWFRTCNYCGSIHPEDLATRLIAQGPCVTCGQTGWEACFRGQAGDSEGHSYDPGGAYASWADRKYGWPHKFYVERLRPKDPKMLHCMGHSSGPRSEPPEWGGGRPWVAAADLTRGQKRIIAADGMHMRGEKFTGWYLFQPKASLHAKFYTAHLADPRIPEEVKAKICAASGLTFHFTEEGNVVRWHAASLSCDAACHPEAAS